MLVKNPPERLSNFSGMNYLQIVLLIYLLKVHLSLNMNNFLHINTDIMFEQSMNTGHRLRFMISWESRFISLQYLCICVCLLAFLCDSCANLFLTGAKYGSLRFTPKLSNISRDTICMFILSLHLCVGPYQWCIDHLYRAVLSLCLIPITSRALSILFMPCHTFLSLPNSYSSWIFLLQIAML